HDAARLQVVYFPRRLTPSATLFPYTTLFRSTVHIGLNQVRTVVNALIRRYGKPAEIIIELARDLKQSKAERDEENRRQAENQKRDRKSTRLNSSHVKIPHAVFCLKKKKQPCR